MSHAERDTFEKAPIRAGTTGCECGRTAVGDRAGDETEAALVRQQGRNRLSGGRRHRWQLGDLHQVLEYVLWACAFAQPHEDTRDCPVGPTPVLEHDVSRRWCVPFEHTATERAAAFAKGDIYHVGVLPPGGLYERAGEFRRSAAPPPLAILLAGHDLKFAGT